MKRVIDIHSHMLPGVDDGCKTKEEALDMLRQYEDQDTEAIICTPHFGPCGVPGADINGIFGWLASTGSPVKLFLGNEIFFTRSTLMDVRRKQARTLAKSKYILVEFDDWSRVTPADYIYNTLEWLVKSEYKPILAHPERYTDLQYRPDYYGKIAKLGVKLQVNAYDIVENPDTAKITQNMLKKKLVSFIGSDAHGASRRAPALHTGVQWIYDHCPESYADAVVHDNAAKIIGGA